MKTAYYAHCVAIYGTPQEARDLQMLSYLGYDVVNPNSPAIDAAYNKVKSDFTAGHELLSQYHSASDAAMTLIFKPIVKSVDVVVFRALPDGRIPAGVAKEILWAREFDKPVIELPHALHDRIMSVESTRDYLSEVGQR